jgi:hypothetical protein
VNASVNTKMQEEAASDFAASLHVPDELAPAAGEAAVLSMVTVRDGASWALASGSLLTVPVDVAGMSWPRWRERQPQARARMEHEGRLDLGPIFCAEPFAGVRAVRAIIDPEGWRPLIESVSEGRIDMSNCPCSVAIIKSTSTVLLGQGGKGDEYDVVAGARRPVLGVVATLKSRELPETSDTWQLAVPPSLERGPDLARMSSERSILFWPKGLLGINWLGGSDFAPPASFVIGRMQSTAWISRVKADFENEALSVLIAWDEHAIDPLGCSLVLRVEGDGLPLLVRAQRISDLPELSEVVADPEPHELSWRDRTLDVRLPRGARRTDWGLTLLASDGKLLDERPVAKRVEQVKIAMHVNGASGPSSVVDIGDRKPQPSGAERDAAIRATIAIEAEAREAAAGRRISTTGELERYLRWRFSCRAGELLVLDPHLLDDKPEAVVNFLAGLGRPVRVLARSVPPAAEVPLSSAPQIDAHPLPNGISTLHDRIWIVGDTGILVGTSVGSFLTDPAGAPRRATTATDLPFADVALWRERFEQWWAVGPGRTRA